MLHFRVFWATQACTTPIAHIRATVLLVLGCGVTYMTLSGGRLFMVIEHAASPRNPCFLVVSELFCCRSNIVMLPMIGWFHEHVQVVLYRQKQCVTNEQRIMHEVNCCNYAFEFCYASF